MALIIPFSHTIHGNRPTLFCTLCPKSYFQHEMADYLKHCSTAHGMEDLAPHLPSVQAPGIYGKDAGDREWGEFIERKKVEDPGGAMRWMKTEAGKHTSGLGDG